MDNSPTITKSVRIDNLLIFFPLWFPIVYISILLNIPSLSKVLFLGTLFLFAEVHFGSTWLFFFDKNNHNWIKKNGYKLIFLPIYCLFLILGLWLINPALVLITHYLASGWHVTRQSIGILGLKKQKNKFNSFLIYSISFACLIIGLNNPGILSDILTIRSINYLLIFVALTYFVLIFSQSSSKEINPIQKWFPVLTGISIYLPILFLKELAHSTAIGVGMHWCQYICIMWAINIRKNTLNKNQRNFKEIIVSMKNKIIFVLIYALLMTTLGFIGMPNNLNNFSEYNLVFLIPIVFQLFHFYIDGFIWKFSDPHIRDSIKSFLFFNRARTNV